MTSRAPRAKKNQVPPDSNFWKNPEERKKTRDEIIPEKPLVTAKPVHEAEDVNVEILDELMELINEAVSDEIPTIDESAQDVLCRGLYDDIRSIIDMRVVVQQGPPGAKTGGSNPPKTHEEIRIALKTLGWPPFKSIDKDGDKSMLLQDVLTDLCNEHNKIPFEPIP